MRSESNTSNGWYVVFGGAVVIAGFWLTPAIFQGVENRDLRRDFGECVFKVGAVEGINLPGDQASFQRENVRTNPFFDACMASSGYELHTENNRICAGNRIALCYDRTSDWVWRLRDARASVVFSVSQWLADR
jgi:hypothetical protein